MNMRTDQGTFGSYHPNDLVEAIATYFKNGGGQANQENHWGLMIYNPNAAMPQYMGQLQEPGNLAPGMQGVEQTKDHSIKTAAQSVRVGFNPDTLNQKLMESIKAPTYSGFQSPLNLREDSSESLVHGFNPDAVNKQLMMSVHSQDHLSQLMAAGNQNVTGSQQGSGIAHAAGSDHHVGYNADQVNAGLYSSMNYNPNAVNSATFSMPSFGGSSGEIKTSSGGSESTSSKNGTSASGNGVNVSGALGNGQGGATGQPFQTSAQGGAVGSGQLSQTSGQGGTKGSGQPFQTSGQGGAMGSGQPFQTSSQGGAMGSGKPFQTSGQGVAMGNEQPFQTSGQGGAMGSGQLSQTSGAMGTGQTGANMAGGVQATGIGGMGPSYPFSATGTGTGSTGGGVLPANRISQNGLPPGISEGLQLSQTEANEPTVNGIGGLGK